MGSEADLKQQITAVDLNVDVTKYENMMSENVRRIWQKRGLFEYGDIFVNPDLETKPLQNTGSGVQYIGQWEVGKNIKSGIGI